MASSPIARVASGRIIGAIRIVVSKAHVNVMTISRTRHRAHALTISFGRRLSAIPEALCERLRGDNPAGDDHYSKQLSQKQI